MERRHWGGGLGVVLALTLAVPAGALDLQAGIHGMAWGSPAGEHHGLRRVRAEGPVAYYVNPQTLYDLASRPVPGVVYGFYRERFFAVYILLSAPDQFHHLERTFTSRYGPPRIATEAAAGLTVYRWEEAPLKIKLKLHEPGAEAKLGIYYAPLAAQLNEEQLDHVPPEAFAPAPPAGVPPPPVPLME